MIAAPHGHGSIYRLFLRNEAEVNAVGSYGGTALTRAAAGGHSSIVRLLLQHHIQSSKPPRTHKDRHALDRFINASEKYSFGCEDWAALLPAACNGHESTMRLLLEQRNDVTQREQKCAIKALQLRRTWRRVHCEIAPRSPG